MASELNQLWRPHLVHPADNFWQAAVIKCPEDTRICGSEWQGRRIKQQWVHLDGVCKVLCKAVTVIKKPVEFRIAS